jgi:hypothetical protein
MKMFDGMKVIDELMYVLIVAVVVVTLALPLVLELMP